ncbi:MAG: isocitrate/isopropylmalate dehydrogenase family protein, partial [Candidatus Puniceispirillales bacterium]
AVIRGDGIGSDCIDATIPIVEKALAAVGMPAPHYDEIRAGAGYYRETGQDIEADGEDRAAAADAILLGAIGLPGIRLDDGTEISPHLRLRDRLGLYAGVRPIRAWPNAPQMLAAPEAAGIDLVLIRESTEGLFYSAAVHGRSRVIDNVMVEETLRITRNTTEKLHEFAFRMASRRQSRGGKGKVTCVDKANVFTAMAFFRQIFDEVASKHSGITADHAYVDAMALELVRRPWSFDVLVTENMFGDILSDLTAGLVGGMGIASCGEIGDSHGLFQPAHGSAPDIMGQDKANPLATILSGGLMLDYLAERSGEPRWSEAAMLIEAAVEKGFAAKALRPMEFGGDMGTRAVARAVLANID